MSGFVDHDSTGPEDGSADGETKDQFDSAPSGLLPLSRNGAQQEHRPVAHLDGLRGLAALMVYFQHHTTEYYGDNSDLLHAFGYKDSHRIGALPFIRIFFTGGAPAVMIFFVLSGYVLSRSSLRMLADGQSPSRHILSAIIRRPIRLFLPPLLLSLPLVFVLHSPLSPVTNPVKLQSNVAYEFGFFCKEILQTFNPFISHGPSLQMFPYNPPIWTMAYEFNGSMLVFGAVYIFGRLAVQQRMMALLVTAVVLFYLTHWSMPCFLAGVMLAQMDLSGLDRSLFKTISERSRLIVSNGLFLLAWLMLTQVAANLKIKTTDLDSPEATEAVEASEDATAPKPPIKVDLISKMLPFPFNYHHWLFANMLGAILLVYTLLRLQWLQHTLGSVKFFKFLGKISFALYLTHVPFIWLVAIPLTRTLGHIPKDDKYSFALDDAVVIPEYGMQGLSTRYLAMQLLVFPLNLMLASLATSTIDNYSVAASKRIATKIMNSLGV